MKEAIWKPIVGFPGYEVNTAGEVRSLNRTVKTDKGSRRKKGQSIKPRPNNCGYIEIRLSLNRKVFTKYLHVLLADVFIPNPQNKSTVNHINGNKVDNRLENLEWCTLSENVKHGYKTGLMNNKAIPVEDICTGEKFASMTQAATKYGVCYCTMRKYLVNPTKYHSCLRFCNPR